MPKTKDRKKHAPGDLPYRPCVGIMVLNRDGLVWAGRRAKNGVTEYTGQPLLWQLPQGGIDKGEDPFPAALRELYEETGIGSVELIEEAPEWINYDLPADLVGIGLKGKYRGQTQKWFAFRFTGDEQEIQIDPPPDGHEREFDDWAWLPMAELPDLIVPFKRGVYEELLRVFGHLAGVRAP
jgi:putative (di)nucleoside polyphosphate hydrolase